MASGFATGATGVGFTATVSMATLAGGDCGATGRSARVTAGWGAGIGKAFGSGRTVGAATLTATSAAAFAGDTCGAGRAGASATVTERPTGVETVARGG